MGLGPLSRISVFSSATGCYLNPTLVVENKITQPSYHCETSDWCQIVMVR